MSKNMNGLLKQAQQMQQKIAMLQKELEEREMDVSSGGGAIKIKITGKQIIKELKVEKDLLASGDLEMIEEVILTGVNHAISESQKMVSTAMSKVTGGLNIPGLF